MNDSRRRDFLKVAGGVAVVGSLAGCAGEAQEDDQPANESEEDQPEEESEPTDEQPEQEQEEQPEEDDEMEATGDDLLRVAHMIPDFPAVDVYVDDGEEPVVSDLEYTDVTDYIPLPAGDHQLRITTASAQGLVIFNEQVSIPAGNTTAVALGTPESDASAGGSDLGFQLELYGDQNTPPENTINDSRLRVVHASPDAPAIDVMVGQTTVFEGVNFGDAAYFDLPAGDYEFDIVPADGGGMDEGGAGGGNESENGGLFSSLTADGGRDISLLQEEENETLPEEGEEEEDTGVEPVYTFDASTEENGVYTAFATGYLDPEAADSEAEFEVIVTQDVIDGEVVEAEDD